MRPAKSAGSHRVLRWSLGTNGDAADADHRYSDSLHACASACSGNRRASRCSPRTSPTPTRPISSAQDLAPLDFSRAIVGRFARWTRTSPDHIAAASGGARSSPTDSSARYEIRPRGNAVSHEDEMMKVAQKPDGLRGGDRALHAQSRPDQTCGQRVSAERRSFVAGSRRS